MEIRNTPTVDQRLQELQAKSRGFDFNKYKQQRIALKVVYFGWDYQGMNMQDNTEKTIDECLLAALIKCRLIESHGSCRFEKCGRTDKGVSAISQVVTVNVRTSQVAAVDSSVTSGIEVSEKSESTTVPAEASSVASPIESTITADNSAVPKPGTTEAMTKINAKINAAAAAAALAKSIKDIQYATVLNRVLPDDIRVIGWCPVADDFSARFSCLRRSYKYYFRRDALDIDKMNDAAERFIGEHDFRNFCKPRPDVLTTIRRLDKVCIQPANESLFECMIEGSGFLWHQVRMMMTVLFLVGAGKEEPQVISTLLDPEAVSARPQYAIASELPLVLFATEFDESIVQWRIEPDERDGIRRHFARLEIEFAIKAKMCAEAILSLPEIAGAEGLESESRSGRRKAVACDRAKFPTVASLCSELRFRKPYRPLLTRPRCLPETPRVNRKDAAFESDSDSESKTKMQKLDD